MSAALCASGCKGPRRPDDIPVQVSLSRSFVRENMNGLWPRCPRRSGDGSQRPACEGNEVLGILFLGLLVIVGIVYAASNAGGTNASVWPEGHEKNYTQEIHWGRNRVWLPAELGGRKVPMVLRVDGNYSGCREFVLDLTGSGTASVRF
jgi:hypothetical protein